MERGTMSKMTVNGRVEDIPEDGEALLADVLRDALNMTGTKVVCGAGVCGACTVLLDGVPVASCLMPAISAAGRKITTIEGIGVPELHPVQKAFMALDALQCGFCTPGFVVASAAFHDNWRRDHGTATPPREHIGAALSGNLCRCGAYDNILRAVAEACAGRYDGDSEVSPRVEARDKVTGLAKYTVDIHENGTLEGLVLRSNVAHARITELDLGPALAIEGVKAAISLLEKDQTVRYVGQQIAAVAAIDRRTARAALAAISFASQPLANVIGADAALRPGAPATFDGGRSGAGNASEGPVTWAPWKGNQRGPSAAFSLRKRKARRWIEAARSESDPLLFEGRFETGVQQHCSLEPHAALARFDGDRLTVHVSTQSVYELAEKIAKRFKLEVENVRVIAQHVGGGFGSKNGLGQETVVAIRLAQEAKAPVRVVYSRHEELSVAGYRPAASMEIALLPAPDGSFKALSLSAKGDSGVAVNSTIAGLARLIYPAQAKYLADFDVVSHLPPASAFRAPGGPPMAFALEQAIDEAAHKLKLDPIDLRRRWDNNPNRQRLYDWASSLDCWRSRQAAASGTGRFRRGVGVAAGYWLYLWQPGTKVELAVADHRLVVRCAAQDIGTGTRSVLADTVARAFDLEQNEVLVEIGDSSLPEGPASGGSRVTASVVPATLQAIEKLKAGLAQSNESRPAPGSNAPWREMIAASPNITVIAERPEDDARNIYGNRSLFNEAGLIGTIFGWMMRRFSHIAVGAGAPSSVQIAEVEVDTLLGRVDVAAVHTGIAVGRLAAPALAHSQAAGAIIQGIGYALYESREVDPRTGDILTGGMEDYRIPGIADTPLIDVHFDEGGFDHVPGGSVGIGEVATVPTAAAIANAISNATAVRPTESPIRPDRLLALLNGGAST
jgi:CO/xanthine dehydrogenase Mo-binding subunit/aerobic-type carbon monoxide dehydrogenase small subunit (CoxS/CutS family)